MAVTAADVKKLRTATGAGMMDCKNALTEANGDYERAVEIIRERGKAIANKRSDREASEGATLAGVSANGKFGAIIALNCETDFVAINEKYVAFAKTILDLAIANQPADVEALLALPLDGRPLAEQIAEQSGVMGEKLEVSYYAKLEGEAVAYYIHPGNKLTTLVAFNKADVDTQVAKDVAMQAAAMAPVALDKDSVPADIAAKELEIAKEKFRQEGKPEAMLDKIAQGALAKFYKESTLVEQAFIKDNKLSVAEYLKSAQAGLAATGFVRFTLDA